MIPSIWYFRESKTVVTKIPSAATRSGGYREGTKVGRGHKVTFRNEKTSSSFDGDSGYTVGYIC